MAKKSTAARQANAARRSQTTPKAAEVTLVRQPKAGNEDVSAKPAKTTVAATQARPKVPEVSRATAASKSVAARAPENVTRPAARTQADRVARAQTSQRARAASHISPEQYGYVRNDLRLIAILAGSMFLFIIILHFVLPIWLQH